jgi:hypothetical protein
MERCPGRVLVSVLVVALSLAAGLVAGAWLSLARARRALTICGVVAWKVACRMGAFQAIWMSNTANCIPLSTYAYRRR